MARRKRTPSPGDALAALRDWPKPARPLRAVVAIPARDEARHLPATLAALRRQRALDGLPLAAECYEIVVLANHCRDATVEVAREIARQRPEPRIHVIEAAFPLAVAHVGTSRKLAMDSAYLRLRAHGAPGAVIASTDADTRVDARWLAATFAAVEAGAAGVVGRIAIDDDELLDRRTLRLQRLDTACALARARLESLIDPDPADPWPRHHQHFGASFAVTADAYARVGGLPPRRFLEDQALYDALRRIDLPVRHDPAVRVRTSNRCDGRVEIGLSWQLAKWQQAAADGLEVLAPDPRPGLAELRQRRLMRDAWQAAREGSVPAWGEVALRLGVPMRWLARRAERAAHFGLLWESVLRRRPQRPSVPSVSPVLALRLLRHALAHETARERRAPAELAEQPAPRQALRAA